MRPFPRPLVGYDVGNENLESPKIPCIPDSYAICSREAGIHFDQGAVGFGRKNADTRNFHTRSLVTISSEQIERRDDSDQIMLFSMRHQ